MTMLLPEFTLHKPKTLDEAVAILKKAGSKNCDFLAGGTDLLPNYKCGLNAKSDVISLNHIAEMGRIEGLRIGACVTLGRIAADEGLKKKIPALAATASSVASVLIQNNGTLGGNLMLDTRCYFFNQSYFWRESLGGCLKADGDICHVVPKIKVDGKSVDNRTVCYATHSSDFAPLVMVLDASYVLVGPEGKREVQATEFYKHDGIARFHKKEGEMLASIVIPEAAAQRRTGYKKLRPRASWDFPVLGVAASILLGSGRKLEELKLVVNAVDTIPLDFTPKLKDLLGKKLDDGVIAEIAQRVYTDIRPKLNVPMMPAYRREMGRVYTRRLLTDLRDSGA